MKRVALSVLCKIRGHDWVWRDWYQHRDYIQQCTRCGKYDT